MSYFVNWTKQVAKKSIPKFQSLTSQYEKEVDVAIIGGGIFGLSTALRLQQAGVGNCVLLEARSVGCSTSGNNTGKLSCEHSLKYDSLTKSFDKNHAQIYRRMNQEGINYVKSNIDKYGIECDFTYQDNYTFTFKKSDVSTLKKEVDAAKDAGLDASFVEPMDLPWLKFENYGAVKIANQAQFNAYAYCVGIAEAFVKEGGTIYENTRVTQVGGITSPHKISIEGGASITAKNVVVATHLPILDRSGHFGMVSPTCSYGVVFPYDKSGNDKIQGMYISNGQKLENKSFRLADDGKALIVTGNGHSLGEPESLKDDPYQNLENFAKNELGVDSSAKCLSKFFSFDYRTGDQLPYIGYLHHGTSSVFTATGFGKWGLAFGSGASEYILQLLKGETKTDYHIFDARRWDLQRIAPDMVKIQAHVSKHLVKDKVKHVIHKTKKNAEDLQPGEFDIANYEGHARGCYKDENGKLSVVDLRCKHLGCDVEINKYDKSFDCPCHGSRYSVKGDILEGPSTKPLNLVYCDIEDTNIGSNSKLERFAHDDSSKSQQV